MLVYCLIFHQAAVQLRTTKFVGADNRLYDDFEYDLEDEDHFGASAICFLHHRKTNQDLNHADYKRPGNTFQI